MPVGEEIFGFCIGAHFQTEGWNCRIETICYKRIRKFDNIMLNWVYFQYKYCETLARSFKTAPWGGQNKDLDNMNKRSWLFPLRFSYGLYWSAKIIIRQVSDLHAGKNKKGHGFRIINWCNVLNLTTGRYMQMEKMLKL